MPSFQFNDSDPRKPFEEPGEYLCTVEDFEFKYAAGSGNEMLVLKLRTSGGALVYDNLIFIPSAWWKIDHALKCFLPSRGHKPPGKGDLVEIDNDWVEEHLKGATGWVTLNKGQTTTGKTRNDVDAYMIPKKGDKPAPETTTKPAQASATSAATTKPKNEPAKAAANPTADDIPF